MNFPPSRPRVFAAVFAILLILGLPARAADPGNGPNIKKSLVRITNTAQMPDYKAPWNPGNLGKGRGTGFVINGNRILTNAHVISNARFLTVERENDPKVYPARVAFVGHDCDLAVLEVEDPAFFTGLVPLAFDGLPEIESTVSVYGYPIGGERMSVTRGIVSRVDFQLYTHSSIDQHLAIQIDAAINPGNSGGPVMQNGKVVGVAFQGYSGDVAQNTGYMIPVPVIERFLKDINDGHYDRYVDLAINYFPLVNPGQRRALGLKDDDRGVVVSSLLKGGSAEEVLKEGDVLLAIDGHTIGSDGFVDLDGERIEMPEIAERKFKGDAVKFLVLRDGKEIEATVTLKPILPNLMQGNEYDTPPRYVIFGGLIFQPLNRNFMTAYSVSSLRLRYYFDQYVNDSLFADHPEVIVLSDILPDPINTYLGGLRQSIVTKINGKEIKTLLDVANAFKQPSEQYVIDLLGEGRPVVLEAAAVNAAKDRIKDRYNIQQDEYLGFAEPEPKP
jgi:S1-C subfamily serine protease